MDSQLVLLLPQSLPRVGSKQSSAAEPPGCSLMPGQAPARAFPLALLISGSLSPWTLVAAVVPSTHAWQHRSLGRWRDPLADEVLREGETLPLCLLQLDFYSLLLELSHELECVLPSDKHFGQDSASDTKISHPVHL